MINYPPKPWYDGQTFIHESSSGNKSKGTYYADKQGWSFSPLNEDGQTGDGEVTTLTVKTINQRPTVTRDPFDIDSSNFQPTNQNDVNWYLFDLIVDNNQTITSINAGSVLQGPEELPFFSKEETRRNRPHIVQGSQQETNYTLLDLIKDNPYNVWLGSEPPGEDVEETYQFWWDTLRLELLISFNGQWWPVAIPPAQLETLRQEIDALYLDTTQNKLNIAVTQQELDLRVLETKERIDVVEETANTAKETADDAKTAADAATIASVNAAQVNQDNTFLSSKTNTFEGNLVSDKQLTITAPSSTNTNPTFQIKGTSTTGTINSVVLNATQSGSRMRVTYKGPIDSDDEITTKKYVDNAVGPAYHKWIFKPDTDKMDLNPGEFTGPRQPTYGNGTHYSYYFHPKSLTGEMEFYKDYNMYFPMNALWGAFHFLNGSKWRLKQYVPVRDIKMFNNDNYLEIYTHTDYPTGGDIIAGFDTDTEYYFAIGGMI